MRFPPNLFTPSVYLLTLLVCSAYSSYNITALSSRDGYSVLERWALAAKPIEAFSAINYGLGETNEAFWSVIEPHTTVGEAWAPALQLTMILTGMIGITAPAPESDQCLGSGGSPTTSCSNLTSRPTSRVAYIMPGTAKSSVLLAAGMRSSSCIRAITQSLLVKSRLFLFRFVLKEI